MHKILFVPLPEPGHILPTLPIARHLAGRGKKVAYLTAPHFRSMVEQVGAHLIPLLPEDVCDRDASGSHIWALFAERNDRNDSRLEQLASAISRLQEQDNYSLLLLDRRLATEHICSLFDGTAGGNVLFSTSLPNWDDTGRDIPNVPTLVLCPELFEIPRFRYPYEFLHYVEPSICSFDDIPFALDQINGTKPLILAAFGTQSVKQRRLENLYKLVAEVARRQDQFQFVMAVPNPEHHVDTSLQLRSSNLFIAERIPQRLLLEKAAVFINHGGLGSIKEAIIAGTPMIIMPSLHDQPFNAMRVRYHGLGEALFEESQTVEALEKLVLAAISGKYTTSLLRMRAHFLALEASAVSHMLIDNRLDCGENTSTLGW